MRTLPIARPRSGGFTLIEALIALSITAVLVAVAVPGIEPLLSQRRLLAATSDFVAALRAAQVEAIRRNRTVEVLFVAGPATAASVTTAAAVASGAAAGRMTRVVNPQGAADFVAGANPTGGPARVSIDAGGVRSIAFTPTGRPLDHTAAPGAALAAPIVVRFTDAPSMRRLCAVVSTGGSTRVCDPTRPAGEPQACPSSLPAPC